MRKKLVLSLSGLAIVTLIVILLWPLSFTNVIDDNKELTIILINTGIKDGVVHNTTTDYVFQPDSEGFIQIRQILSDYSFHRSFRSFFSDTSMNDNDAGYWLQLHSGGKSIISGGTGEVTVDYHVYRIGYWGNKTALAMMNDIRSVLD